MAKSIFTKKAIQKARSLKSKVTKARNKQRVSEIESKASKSASKSSRARRQEWLDSNNPIKKFIARREDIGEAKHQAKIDKIRTKAETKALDPQLRLMQEQTKADVVKAKAQSRAKFAGYAAMASGASTLGKGLAAENNQDDAAERKHESDIIHTIFGDSAGTSEESDGALKQGVI